MIFRLGKTVLRLREIAFRVAEMVLAVGGPMFAVFAVTSTASSQFKPKRVVGCDNTVGYMDMISRQATPVTLDEGLSRPAF